MIKTTALLLLLGAACVTGRTWAADTAELAKAKHRFECHDTAVDKIGPSFRNIARRFHGLNNSKVMLARMIEAGDNPVTALHWGADIMAPSSAKVPVSPEEAQVLADYVLSFK